MKIEVEIIETLSLVTQVDAASVDEAVQSVKQAYRDGEIVLTPNNANADYEIKPV